MNKKFLTSRSWPIICCSIILVTLVGAGLFFRNFPGLAMNAAHAAAPRARASDVQVFVEPAAGDTPIVNAINNAKTSIDLEMYLLTEKNVISALENAAKRGVNVQVMLEPNPFGGGSQESTITALNNAGVKAEDSNPAFALTHEKGMVIDGTTAYIMTSNFTLSALGGSSSTTNREYDIIDTNATDVQKITDVFNADWQRASYTSTTDSAIVLSPINSRDDFINFINNAQTSLIIEAEEMQDASVIQAIVSAESRGVAVQVILPNDTSNDTGISTLDKGGVSVRKDTQYYMHAKMMVADGKVSFVGSENISSNSLDKNRELGILVSNTTVISTLKSTFQSDWSNSKAA